MVRQIVWGKRALIFDEVEEREIEEVQQHFVERVVEFEAGVSNATDIAPMEKEASEQASAPETEMESGVEVIEIAKERTEAVEQRHTSTLLRSQKEELFFIKLLLASVFVHFLLPS
ncbi:hypothetical protein HDU98_001218 [Podochytrium sp. JEL0797]|nr:hypothetical protein HDU98_001218 [Podochytrium sp. JEL0797]